MHSFCLNAVEYKSVNPMLWLGAGLALSYSFLG